MSATAFQRRRRELAKQDLEQKPTPKVPTADEIAEMRKPEVKEWLEAHGVDDPKGTVAELRSALTKTLYSGL